MKPFTPIVTILWMITCALAATPDLSRFEKYQSLSRSRPLDLDDSTYEDLTSKPRDYHVAVILTATDARYGCILCRDFQPEWDLITRSWNKGSKPDELKLVFATLDFSQGKATFQKVCVFKPHSQFLAANPSDLDAVDATNRTCRARVSSNHWPLRQS